jgi:hypothetical protein
MSKDTDDDGPLLTVDSGAAAHGMAARHYCRASIKEHTRLGFVLGDGGTIRREVFDESARLNLIRYVPRVLAAFNDQNL